MQISEFQNLMHKIYFAKDSSRGIAGTYLWLIEELGELAEEIRKKDKEALKREFSDSFAWLASLANLLGVNLEETIKVYENGCPKCGKIPCRCIN